MRKSGRIRPRAPRSWRRFTLSIAGIIIIAANWRWAVAHLYTLPEHSIAAFTSITNNAHYVIAGIVVFMVTGRLVYDWSNARRGLQNLIEPPPDDPPPPPTPAVGRDREPKQDTPA